MPDFAAPLWLTLLPLPWLVQRFYNSNSPAHIRALKHPQADILFDLTQKDSQALPPASLWLLGITLFVIALAQPQWKDSRVIPFSGHNIMLTLDVSGSMGTLGASSPNLTRFDQLKFVVSEFLSNAGHDRIGMVAFGSEAVTLSPLTSDKDLLNKLLNTIQTSALGEKTAIGDALSLAVKHLSPSNNDETNTIILITDGNNTTGETSPFYAANLARERNIPIYTVSIGHDSETLTTNKGSLDAPLLAQQNVAAKPLHYIASHTGGEYLHAETIDGLSNAFKRINANEKSAENHPQELVKIDFYWLPLLLGLLCLSCFHYQQEYNVLPQQNK